MNTRESIGKLDNFDIERKNVFTRSFLSNKRPKGRSIEKSAIAGMSIFLVQMFNPPVHGAHKAPVLTKLRKETASMC